MQSFGFANLFLKIFFKRGITAGNFVSDIAIAIEVGGKQPALSEIIETLF